MALLSAQLVQPSVLTTPNRDLLSLGFSDTGRMIFNLTASELQVWDGSMWQQVLQSPEVDGGVY